MHRKNRSDLLAFLSLFVIACCIFGWNSGDAYAQSDSNTGSEKAKTDSTTTASRILGSPDHLAISFGGFRHETREKVPTVAELKEDMLILSAMGIRILRTYNTQQFAHAKNILKAIREIRKENPKFEMYVMLGAWIDCQGAWNDKPDHEKENIENNQAEMKAAIKLANEYPESVKIISVGNEAMVHWATAYFVEPKIILKWVRHLQELKKEGKLPSDLWITSSDNFASWGGGDGSYHNEDLNSLIRDVDYVSMHTYPFHDSHYNSKYWLDQHDPKKDEIESARAAIDRALKYAQSQYESTSKYVRRIAANKPIHIGETGWASASNSLYGKNGSGAADEFKAKLYYDGMRKWTASKGLGCFYFEAFDESWKDAKNPGGSENHFGLINLKGQAKYVLWDQVDKGTFKGLTRGGNKITKTFDGDEKKLFQAILTLPQPKENESK